MQDDLIPTDERRRKMLIAALAGATLALIALAIWYASSGVREPPPSEVASKPDLGAADAQPDDAMSFDAEGLSRKPRKPTRIITSREVRRLQKRYGSQIKYCYQKPSRRAALLIQRKSNVVVHLATFGKVTRVDVDAGGDRELQACLRRFIKRWRFPKNLGAQQVRFPIVFAR